MESEKLTPISKYLGLHDIFLVERLHKWIIKMCCV